MTVIEKANKADGSLSASSKSVPVGTTAPGGKNGPSRWQTASRKASGVRRTQWIEKAEPIGRLKGCAQLWYFFYNNIRTPSH
jgi:hypothetical protein